MKKINALLDDNKDKFDSLGIQLGDLGSHSTWKSSAAVSDTVFTFSSWMARIF